MGKYVKVKRPYEKTKKVDEDALFAELCFYYPQYRMSHRHVLPYKYVVLLLNTARRKKAEEWTYLTHIAAAPHTEKGKGVKKLIEHFKEMANG